MKIINYDELTGWAQVELDGHPFTVRLTDYPSLDAVKKILTAEIKKQVKKPKLKFDLPKGE